MNKIIVIISILIISMLLISGCKEEQKEEPKMPQPKNNFIAQQPEDVSIRTSDDKMIKATFYPNSDSDKGLILVHQLGKDRSSWKEWILDFQKTHNVLAIDLRGHGESEGDYSTFSEQDFKDMITDVKAAQSYLKQKNIEENKISYIGASIGANTVQNFVSENNFDNAVLLSPGLTYKGIDLNMQDNTILAIVSKEDSFSFDTVNKLKDKNTNSKFIFLENKGHGTNMLDKQLVIEIINFING